MYMYHNGSYNTIIETCFTLKSRHPRVIDQPWPTAQHDYFPINTTVGFQQETITTMPFSKQPHQGQSLLHQIQSGPLSASHLRQEPPSPQACPGCGDGTLLFGLVTPEAAVNKVVPGAGRGPISKRWSSRGESSIQARHNSAHLFLASGALARGSREGLETGDDSRGCMFGRCYTVSRGLWMLKYGVFRC